MFVAGEKKGMWRLLSFELRSPYIGEKRGKSVKIAPKKPQEKRKREKPPKRKESKEKRQKRKREEEEEEADLEEEEEIEEGEEQMQLAPVEEASIQGTVMNLINTKSNSNVQEWLILKPNFYSILNNPTLFFIHFSYSANKIRAYMEESQQAISMSSQLVQNNLHL